MAKPYNILKEIIINHKILQTDLFKASPLFQINNTYLLHSSVLILLI